MAQRKTASARREGGSGRVADPSVYLERLTLPTVGHVEHVVITQRDCRILAIVVEGETCEEEWSWNTQYRDEQQREPGTGSTIGGLWLCGQANSPNPHLHTVTFGVDSGAEVTVMSPDTASDYPRERGPCFSRV